MLINNSFTFTSPMYKYILVSECINRTKSTHSQFSYMPMIVESTDSINLSILCKRIINNWMYSS